MIDLKKCNLILNNALEMASMTEAKSNVVHDFATYASKSSLDTFFMILFVALGNLSDSKEIKNFSLFSCLLLASNFLIFITVYPALISLILQFKSQQIHDASTSTSKAQPASTSTSIQNKGLTDKLVFDSLTNPVLVYVKILMTLFLIVIHLKSKIFTPENEGNKLASMLSTLQGEKVVAYTQYCLLVTLLVFLVTKIFSSNKSFAERDR